MQIANPIYLRIKRLSKWFSFLLIVVLFASCTEEIASPPVVSTFVNDVATTEATVTGGDIVNYRFEISANTTIADLKMVVFDVLSPSIKTPSQTLVAGLTNKLDEVVKGTLVAKDDTEIMLIVMDVDGNEVSESILLTVQ